jgi:hypothetical protein
LKYQNCLQTQQKNQETNKYNAPEKRKTKNPRLNKDSNLSSTTSVQEGPRGSDHLYFKATFFHVLIIIVLTVTICYVQS